jgi:hypothetical protein
MYLGHGNGFGHTGWYSSVMYVKWKLVLVCLEIVFVLTQDRCMVCDERSIGSEIILTHPMVLLGDVVQVEARFNPFRDSVNLSA